VKNKGHGVQKHRGVNSCCSLPLDTRPSTLDIRHPKPETNSRIVKWE